MECTVSSSSGGKKWRISLMLRCATPTNCGDIESCSLIKFGVGNNSSIESGGGGVAVVWWVEQAEQYGEHSPNPPHVHPAMSVPFDWQASH